MISKPFIISLFVSISLSCLFGYLSYSYSEKIGVLETKLTVCSDNNKSLVSDVEKATKACSITDAVVKENTEEQKVLEDKREEVLSQLDNLPSTPKNTLRDAPTERIIHEQEAVVQTNTPPPVVDIDSSLPDDLTRLLNEAYRNSIQE